MKADILINAVVLKIIYSNEIAFVATMMETPTTAME